MKLKTNISNSAQLISGKFHHYIFCETLITILNKNIFFHIQERASNLINVESQRVLLQVLYVESFNVFDNQIKRILANEASINKL